MSHMSILKGDYRDREAFSRAAIALGEKSSA